MSNSDSDNQPTYTQLRDELDQLKIAYETERTEARMMARGWQHNTALMLREHTALTTKLRHTLQRVGEFLRFFGPLPYEYYTQTVWQVETDYLPVQDETVKFLVEHQGEEHVHSFWRGVFRERARQGLC